MRTNNLISLVSLVSFILVSAVSGQAINLEAYKIPDVLPVERETPVFTKIYQDSSNYVPFKREVANPNTDTLIVHGVTKLTFEQWKKWEENMITAEVEALETEKRTYETEVKFASKKAEEAYEEAMENLSKEGKEGLRKLVLVTYENFGPVEYNSVNEFITHPFN